MLETSTEVKKVPEKGIFDKILDTSYDVSKYVITATVAVAAVAIYFKSKGE